MITKILWSKLAYIGKYWDAAIHDFVSDTNANELFNALPRSCDFYRIPCVKSIDTMKLVHLQEKANPNDARRVLCRNGALYQGVSCWKRLPQKKK